MNETNKNWKRIQDAGGAAAALAKHFFAQNFAALCLLFAAATGFTRCHPPAALTGTQAGFKEIFDGKTLNGWQGDSLYWRVEKGAITGETTPASLLKKHNSFLIWQGGEPANFELKVVYKISAEGNSGINYRSEKITGEHALKGYQADIDGEQNYSGSNYEERGRTTLAARGEIVLLLAYNENKTGAIQNFTAGNVWTNKAIKQTAINADSLKSFINNGEWNEYHIIANGYRLQHYINGILMSDVSDKDTLNRKMKGLLGVQVHVGPPMLVQYKSIRLKTL